VPGLREGSALAILVLAITSWPRIRQLTARIQATIVLIHICGHEDLLPPSSTSAATTATTRGSNDRPMISPMPVRWPARVPAATIRLPASTEPVRASGGDDRIPDPLLLKTARNSRRGAAEDLQAGALQP
jgi:hypothetical protein